jgi:serine/threonine-protein kinase
MPLSEGAQFAGFTIVRQLGAGGTGEVYLASHPRLPRQEALKILPSDVSADPEYRQRFYREAELASSLWHPHIVSVHDRGESEGQLWISMDYVEGADAGQLLRRRPSGNGLGRADTLEIVAAVADALDYAHEKGLLHRDVKPANILLTAPRNSVRRVLLADFGIARQVDDISGLTATNMTVGTVSYAAPEQLMDGAVDGRADQYSLAATAYHLLTGAPPFQHSNPAVVISHHLNAAPPSMAQAHPELGDLDAVLARALAKDPADRYARSADFAAALASPLATAPSVATRSPKGSAISPDDATMAATLAAEPTQAAPATPRTAGSVHEWAEIAVRRPFRPGRSTVLVADRGCGQ